MTPEERAEKIIQKINHYCRDYRVVYGIGFVEYIATQIRDAEKDIKKEYFDKMNWAIINEAKYEARRQALEELWAAMKKLFDSQLRALEGKDE